MHHFSLCLVAMQLPKDKPIPCHSEAGPIGQECACSAAKQQIPGAAMRRFGVTILWGFSNHTTTVSHRIFVRRLAHIIGEDGEAKLKTAGCVSLVRAGCNFFAPARDHRHVFSDGSCGRLSPAWRDASGACAIELPVLPTRTQFCRRPEFLDFATVSGCRPRWFKLIADRDLG